MPILTAEERIGQRIVERYRVDAVLSSGGMGVLFRALDEATGSQVAIKMLKPAHTLEEDRVARFVRETRIASALSHPNMARVLDVSIEETGVPFLIMELLEGRSLAQELDARGSLPLAEALAIAVPIAGALAIAHAAGVVHRDIKPSNIFLCRDSVGTTTPKLLDFGIARSMKDDFETQSGMLLGTPGYMAPEHAQYGECGPHTDIWGLGAVIYRCLAGHAPHAGGSVQEMLGKLVREPVPTLEPLGIGRQACATIERALARDPHQRYASMGGFGRALCSLANLAGSTSSESTQAFEPTLDVEAACSDLASSPPLPTVALALPQPDAMTPYPHRQVMLGAGLLGGLLLLHALAPRGAGKAEWRATDDATNQSLSLTSTAPPTYPSADASGNVVAERAAAYVSSSSAALQRTTEELGAPQRPPSDESAIRTVNPRSRWGVSTRVRVDARMSHVRSAAGTSEASVVRYDAKASGAASQDPMDRRR